MKNLRKTFFGSVVSLLICFTMLLGTTFAWFTDSVSSVGNKIIAGTLDIELHQYVHDEATDTWSWKNISAVTAPLFDYDLWEPGYTEYVVLKVVNNGSLALKWKATFSSTNVLSELADVINVYVLPTAPAAEGTYNNFNAPANRAAALAYTPAGTVRSFVSQIEDVTKGELKANEEACLTLVLQMDPNAGNDYMNLDLGGAFDISIVATQNTVESDDFGTDYDADAVYPGCEHTSTSTTTTYNKTATGHTAVTTEKCNDCHAVFSTTPGTEEAHVDTNPADNVCDVCEYAMTPVTPAHTHSEKWAQDSTGETHTSYCDTNDCDGTFVPTINEACADGNDADNLCDKCGRDLTPAACNHVDANHDGECDNCGETGLAVSHDYTSNYNHDETHHWGVCSCGDEDTNNKVAHDFSHGYCVCGQAPLFDFETDENNPVVVQHWFEQIFNDTTNVAAMVTAMQTPNAQLVIKYVGEENVITDISIGAPLSYKVHGYHLGTPVSSEYDGTYRYVTYSNTDILGVLAACKDNNEDLDGDGDVSNSLLDQAASFAIEDNLPNVESNEYVEANATKVYAVYVIIPNN